MGHDPLPHILLVEDNLGDICVFRLALKQADLDCELTVLRDGAEALEFVRRQGSYAKACCPDLAVLDLMLPKHDAIEILQAIRSSDHMRNVPAVILTSLIRPPKLIRMDGLQIERHIIKPSDLKEFLKIGVVLKDILFDSRRNSAASGN